jgi:transcriptional regulator with XRE-family HTH domain
MTENYFFIQNLAGNLTRLRKEKGMKQEDLAKAIGVTKNSISNIEKQRSFPTLANLDKMARIFNATPNQLFGTSQEIELERAVYSTDEYSERIKETLSNLRTIEQFLSDDGFEEQINKMTYLTTRQPIIDGDGSALYWKLDAQERPIKEMFYHEEQLSRLQGNFELARESETPLEKLAKDIV